MAKEIYDTRKWETSLVKEFTFCTLAGVKAVTVLSVVLDSDMFGRAKLWGVLFHATVIYVGSSENV